MSDNNYNYSPYYPYPPQTSGGNGVPGQTDQREIYAPYYQPFNNTRLTQKHRAKAVEDVQNTQNHYHRDTPASSTEAQAAQLIRDAQSLGAGGQRNQNYYDSSTRSYVDTSALGGLAYASTLGRNSPSMGTSRSYSPQSSLSDASIQYNHQKSKPDERGSTHIYNYTAPRTAQSSATQNSHTAAVALSALAQTQPVNLPPSNFTPNHERRPSNQTINQPPKPSAAQRMYQQPNQSSNVRNVPGNQTGTQKGNLVHPQAEHYTHSNAFTQQPPTVHGTRVPQIGSDATRQPQNTNVNQGLRKTQQRNIVNAQEHIQGPSHTVRVNDSTDGTIQSKTATAEISQLPTTPAPSTADPQILHAQSVSRSVPITTNQEAPSQARFQAQDSRPVNKPPSNVQSVPDQVADSSASHIVIEQQPPVIVSNQSDNLENSQKRGAAEGVAGQPLERSASQASSSSEAPASMPSKEVTQDEVGSKEEIEAGIKEMIKKMRKYKQQDPKGFTDLWEQFKKVQPATRASPQANTQATPIQVANSVTQPPREPIAARSPATVPRHRSGNASAANMGHSSSVGRRAGSHDGVQKPGFPTHLLCEPSPSADVGSEGVESQSVDSAAPNPSDPEPITIDPDIEPRNRLQILDQQNPSSLASDEKINETMAESMKKSTGATAPQNNSPKLRTERPQPAAEASSGQLPLPTKPQNNDSSQALSPKKPDQEGGVSGKPTLWPVLARQSIASIAKSILETNPANAGKSISAEEIRSMLDRGLSYMEVCDMLESKKFAFKRSFLARALLSAIAPQSSPAPAGSSVSGTPQSSTQIPCQGPGPPQKDGLLPPQSKSAISDGRLQSSVVGSRNPVVLDLTDSADTPQATQLIPNSQPIVSQTIAQPHRNPFSYAPGLVMQGPIVQSRPQFFEASAFPPAVPTPLMHQGRVPVDFNAPYPSRQPQWRVNPQMTYRHVQSKPPVQTASTAVMSLISATTRVRTHVDTNTPGHQHGHPSALPSGIGNVLTPASGATHPKFGKIMDRPLQETSRQANIEASHPQISQASPKTMNRSQQAPLTSYVNSNFTAPNQSAVNNGRGHSPFSASHRFWPSSTPEQARAAEGYTQSSEKRKLNSGRARISVVRNPNSMQRPPIQAQNYKYSNETIATPLNQESDHTSPRTKEQMARKRNFSEIVDLTELSNDEATARPKRVDVQGLSNSQKGIPFVSKSDERWTKDAQAVEHFKPSQGVESGLDLSKFRASNETKGSERESLRSAEIVKPIDRKMAAKKSFYDSTTLVSDILIAKGMHPTKRPLNWHLEPLRNNFWQISNHSDLSTIRWDLIDPGSPSTSSGKENILVNPKKRSADGATDIDVPMTDSPPFSTIVQTASGKRRGGGCPRRARGSLRLQSRGRGPVASPSPADTGSLLLQGGIRGRAASGKRPMAFDEPRRHLQANPLADATTVLARDSLLGPSPGGSTPDDNMPPPRQLPATDLESFLLPDTKTSPVNEIANVIPRKGTDVSGLTFSLGGNTLLAVRVPSYQQATTPTSDPPPKRRGRPLGSRSVGKANSLAKLHSPGDVKGPGISVVNQSPSSVFKKRGRPFGSKNQVVSGSARRPSSLRTTISSYGIGIVLPSRSPSVVSSSLSYIESRPKDHVKRAKKSPPRHASPASYQIFACRWNGCPAKLHNLETLRKHIFKLHARKLTEDGRIACLWSDCQFTDETVDTLHVIVGPAPPTVTYSFETEDTWKDHVEGHIRAIAREHGDGPSTHPIEVEPSSYLSDSSGRQVTPLARYGGAPDPFPFDADYPLDGKTATARKAYEIAHGQKASWQKTKAVEVAKPALEVQIPMNESSDELMDG